MSRRRSSANNGGGGGGDEPSEIRGPTSALTQFLKDQGIRSRPRNPFQRRVSEAEAAAAAAGPSGTSSPAPSTSASGALTPGGISNIAEDDNDEADDDDDLPSASAGPSFPGTPASERDEGDVYAQASTSRTTIEITTTTVSSATKKRKAPAAADKKKGKGKKKKKGEGDEDDDDDYDDGEFELQVTGTPKSRYGDRKPGSFAMCAECNKKFTITRYTNAHPDLAGGVLCGPCDKEIGPASGQVQGGKAAGSGGAGAAAKKRARAVKNKTVLNKEKPSVMSLTKCCIEIIGKAIQDVEEFGDIGGVNRDKVCQIVCKNRDLTMETLQLFLDVENTSLTLYDCARLEPEALRTVANHCPNLEILRLYMCGFLDGPTVLHFANRLTKLKQLELYAAFLVRKEHWHDFFDVLAREKRGPAFEGFLIRQTPRIDNGVLGKLVETCANLTHLQLAECGALDDSSLAVLGGLKKLRHLDLSHGGLKGESFTDDGMVPLLEAVGRALHALILDENVLLTDRTLIEGVKVNCTELIELSLRNVGELLPTGVAELFAPDWVNQRGMVRVNLARCHQLDDQAIEAVLRHSGTSLLKLDLNSVDGLTAELGLKLLAESCPNLTELDVSFVREVDDFVLKNLLDRLPAIQRIYIYGNNRISDSCPQKAGVKVLGHEQGVVNFD